MRSQNQRAKSVYARQLLTVCQSPRAFTLVELLVVIAILSIFSALLLPALGRAKEEGRRANCMSNLHQLTLCWEMYADDNQGIFAPNNWIDYAGIGGGFNTSMSWCNGNALTDTTTSNIQSGLLFPYNTSTDIYHCPSDFSMIVDADGHPLPQLRTRSYNMSQSVNGRGLLVDPYFNAGQAVDVTQPCFQKLSQVTNPPPDRLFVFIDENEGTMEDDQFGYPMINSGYYGKWLDIPANRHHQAGNLSFADGHIEYWRWHAPMIATLLPGQLGQVVTDGQRPDYLRIGNAMRIKPIDGRAD